MTSATLRTPNFFIAGAPNAGTTSLYHYLRQHPQVFMSPEKEPTFFGAAEFRAERAANPQRPPARQRPALERWLRGAPKPLSWEDYLELFRDAREEPAVGEASIRYLLLPAAARAIRERVPNARLIFVLRDPADWLFTRYLSFFWRDPPGTFRRRFLAGMDPSDVWASSVAVGRYATHLGRFFDVFPREQLQIHLYEDYQADGRAVVRDIFTFLGVDPAYPVDMSRRHNETLVPRLVGLERLRRRVLGAASITTWLPSSARRTLRRLLYRRRPALTTMDPADRALVIDYYRDEVVRAGDLIGRDLSAWLR